MKASISLILLFLTCVYSRYIGEVTINGHSWLLPDHEGWKEFVSFMDTIQSKINTCLTAADCLKEIKLANKLIEENLILSQYVASLTNSQGESFSSIFRWGK